MTHGVSARPKGGSHKKGGHHQIDLKQGMTSLISMLTSSAVKKNITEGNSIPALTKKNGCSGRLHNFKAFQSCNQHNGRHFMIFQCIRTLNARTCIHPHSIFTSTYTGKRKKIFKKKIKMDASNQAKRIAFNYSSVWPLYAKTARASPRNSTFRHVIVCTPWERTPAGVSFNNSAPLLNINPPALYLVRNFTNLRECLILGGGLEIRYKNNETPRKLLKLLDFLGPLR